MTDDKLELADRHALVTGGGHGIGAAIAAALARRGAAVTVAGRNSAALSATADSIASYSDRGCRPLELAVDDTGTIGRALDQARSEFGPITILVNNAGVAPSAGIADLGLDSWNQTFAVNSTAPFLLSQAVLPDMLDAGFGRIVNVASTAGLRGYPYVSAYVASKHALIGLTRALALELARTPVTVNAVCPGYTDTEMAQQAIRNIMSGGKSETEARAILTRGNPQGRLVQPEEVAETVTWLCLPSSAAMNGQSLAVAGGEVM